ncbi:hypothetical protein [Rhodobacter sp. CZR27]|uniref:hypothetical protein n=1 Tax=Rhodobacter sp. CZR27 TaxID=2033869 RepID=UPI000BBEA0A3|nr:hypothetical protein [Rhodobacter sp. CZR27]
MLMMTPAALEMQRALTRRERDARRERIAKVRADVLVRRMAIAMLTAFAEGRAASVFAYEGPFRHGIRATLCLQGWRWASADEAAAALVGAALDRIKAKRPDWNQGQPEWTVEGGALIERTRCIRCGTPLPDGHHKFCSSLCGAAHHAKVARIKAARDGEAAEVAIRSL